MPKYLILSLLLLSCHVSSADNFEQLLQKNIASLSEKVFKSADNEQLLDDYNQKRMSFINFAEDNVFSCGFIGLPYQPTPKILYQLTYQTSKETWTPLANNHSVISYWQVN
ncbi:hypothetical protein [Shewanella kaireitica]|uniref:hypothetical protein n=1 Tax=Shewanella kaireitica TaxID=212021 RepID=UPI00200FAFDD|nr:hypothetical protein [Shewanella kaireitica]MCL1093567.1 hypothetical protein [Shewanella kaireitica]